MHIEESYGKKLTKSQKADIIITGTYQGGSDYSMFVGPRYGEVEYQYRQSRAGWLSGKNK